MNKCRLKVTIIYVSSLLIFLLLDFFNILSFFTHKINSNYLGIYVEAATAVYLFFLTYFSVDKKINDNKKEEKDNKQDALYIMLMRSYINCKSTLDIINDPNILEKYVIPKCNFNVVKDDFIEMQKNSPFEFDDQISNMMIDGVVDKSLIIEYFNIKSMYRKYINMRIVLFDIEKYEDKKSKELKKLLEIDRDNLSSTLNKAIKNIDRFI